MSMRGRKLSSRALVNYVNDEQSRTQTNYDGKVLEYLPSTEDWTAWVLSAETGSKFERQMYQLNHKNIQEVFVDHNLNSKGEPGVSDEDIAREVMGGGEGTGGL